MVNSPHNDDEPLQELKHDAVPGYFRAFLIAFTAMTIYLAVILVSSPGPASGHHEAHGHGPDDQNTGGHEVEAEHHNDSH